MGRLLGWIHPGLQKTKEYHYVIYQSNVWISFEYTNHTFALAILFMIFSQQMCLTSGIF
jgi:hypothetical protein